MDTTDFLRNRHKDRKSATSKLEPEESLRFQRAMYRYWLCLDMLHYGAFGPNDETDTEEDEDEDEDEDRATKLSIKAFLEGFSTDKLVEILSVESFCEETMHWQSGKSTIRHGTCQSSEFRGAIMHLVCRCQVSVRGH